MATATATSRGLKDREGTLNLLAPQDREGTFSTRLFSRYRRNEKALVLDVRRRGIDQEAQGHNWGAVRHDFLQESGLFAGERPLRRARSVEGPPASGEGLPLPVRRRPLREGQDESAGGEPGGARGLGREGGWDARDPRRGGGRNRERGDLSGTLSVLEATRVLGLIDYK